MSLLTLANLMNDVLLEIPGKEQAAIVGAVNKVVRRIQTEFVEPRRTTFTTRAKTESGTVAVTQDSTLVTFSGTPLLSTDPVMLIQVTGDSAWIILTYASTSTGTLSSKWAADTDAAATYQIVYPTVSFPNTVGEVTKVQRPGFDPLAFRVGGSCPWLTGVPESWSPYVHDETSAAPSDDLTRIFLDPAPDARILYEVWVRSRTTKLDPAGATTQTIPLPDLWEEAIVQGALFFLWKQESGGAEKSLLASGLYEAAIARARASQLPAAVIPRTQRSPDVFGVERRPVTYG